MKDEKLQVPDIQCLGSEIVFACPWYQVRRDRLIWPDGTAGEYNVLEAPRSIFVVPVTPAGEIVLIRQYRYTTQRWVWEVPAGAVKVGQTLEEAVAMELREEVGGVSDHIVLLGEFETANGRSDEIAHIFMASDVILGENDLESAEILTIHPTSITQIRHMLATNQIKDAPSALGIMLALQYIQDSIEALGN